MFIVLEGIDGAGKGRQRSELATLFKNKKIQLYTQEFPNHQSVIYKHLIHPGLHEQIKIPNQAWFLAFALDQILEQEKIALSVKSNSKFALCDGYFTTNLVYQALVNKNIKLKEALQFAKQYKIAVPDLTIFIDADPKNALSWKQAEHGHDEGLDINERDLKKQYQIRAGFLKLAKNNIFGKWVIVDGNATIAEVTQKILAALNKRKIIKL